MQVGITSVTCFSRPTLRVFNLDNKGFCGLPFSSYNNLTTNSHFFGKKIRHVNYVVSTHILNPPVTKAVKTRFNLLFTLHIVFLFFLFVFFSYFCHY